MIEADVVVVGAGPTGAACALNLAPRHRVLVVDRGVTTAPRVGESLAPAARRLLSDMGLWQAFLEQGHAPRHAIRSVWGSAQWTETTDLRDLDGSGWHLDRCRFDVWLRHVAVQRGAAILTPARVHDAVWDNEMWRGELNVKGRRMPVGCRLMVDASGRGASLVRAFGVRRTVQDRLVCGWLHGRDLAHRQSGLTLIEAEPGGWWYSAPLPDNRRVIAFHTDADLPAATVAAAGGQALLHRVTGLSLLRDTLAASRFAPDGHGGFCAAQSTTLDCVAGDGWLAAGDAALGVDPLAAQGLLNALYSGLAAAEAADQLLRGNIGASATYQASISAVTAAYQAHLRAWYGLERRWPEQAFWQRRLAQPPETPVSDPGSIG